MVTVNNSNNSSPLLINESPLQVLPSLAVALGNVNEAIILQQIQYWLKNPKSGRIGEDGRKYVRDTFDEWQVQFPWLSIRSIKNLIKDLKEREIVLTTNLNKSSFDRTQWYSIDYEKLNQFVQKESEKNAQSDSAKNAQSKSAESAPCDSAEFSPTIPKTSSKTSSETSTKNSKKGNVPPKGETTEEKEKDKNKQVEDNIPYEEIINYLNSKTGKSLRYNTKSYQRLIKARWNDGYRVKDFKQVIDNKAFSWQGTDFWKFMRPDTLFASKHFDDYLNENNTDGAIPHGGYDIDEKAQQEFLNQVKDEDLPF